MRNLTLTILLSCLVFLFGCSKQKSKWEEAKKANTILAFDEYTQQFPESPFVKDAKANISKLIVLQIKEKIFNNSYMPNSNDDYLLFWNGKLIDKIVGQKISYDGVMGSDGNLEPVPGKTRTTFHYVDNSLKMECFFESNGTYRLTQNSIADNTVIEMKSGAKYTYKNGQFEK
jgi:hypothetical protein